MTRQLHTRFKHSLQSHHQEAKQFVLGGRPRFFHGEINSSAGLMNFHVGGPRQLQDISSSFLMKTNEEIASDMYINDYLAG